VSVLFAFHAYPSNTLVTRRNAAGLASLLRLDNIRVVNVQTADPLLHVHGVPTLAVLERDSMSVTGVQGPKKPIIVDIFDGAAREAKRGGERYFAFANSDIEVSQEAIDLVLAQGRQAYVFARLDYDAVTRQAIGLETAGSDMFVLDVDWWVANRSRFRDYILGERTWDNVFSSIILCHSDGLLLNRDALIRHERHPSGAADSPYAAYTQFLAALDRPYFTLWAEYYWHLVPLRAQNASAEAEEEVSQRTFRFQPGLRARALQLGREMKARIRFRDTLRKMPGQQRSR
jgi:hypothetical protein